MPLALALMLAAGIADRPLPDLELLGREPRRTTVVVFLRADCPMAKLYAPRLQELAKQFPEARFVAVNASEFDEAAAIAGFPLVRDSGGRAAELFGATHSPHAFVLDAERRVRYRGRIDDQYTRGTNRGKPTREDVAEALKEVLAGRTVSVPATETTGCVLSRPKPAAASQITYSRDIAPILARECRSCHQPGEVAPFPLLSYANARKHAETMLEVVENGTMPPWHAAPEFGKFRNERRLSAAEKRLIAEWVRLGCPEGESTGVSPAPNARGRIEKPDAVYRIPAEFEVPAQGIIEYQHFLIDPGFKTDTWVRAAEVRPGNRQVVHHCTVFLTPPNWDRTDIFFETGSLGSHSLIAFTPGCEPVRFPEGTAKRVPAGWRFHVIVHYVAVGSPQTDRTEVAVQFADRSQVKHEVGTKLIYDPELAIPPHAANHTVEKTWTADRNYRLLAMLPHMHLRGKSFRFAAEYPDGTGEVLLDVPAYDFNWQHRYELAEAKRLPACTVIRCTAVFDNSAANPNNPDPSATVRAGEQTRDEMFNGYLDIVSEDEIVDDPPPPSEGGWLPKLLLASTALATGWWGLRLRRGRAMANGAT